MFAPKRLLLLPFALVVLLACSMPLQAPKISQGQQPDIGMTMTALPLQQTQIALQLTQRALSAPSTTPLPPTPTRPLPASATSLPTRPLPTTASPSPTPTIASPTSTPQSATTTSTAAAEGLPATATGNLYCRTGPAPYYPAVDIMTAGEKVTVLARAPKRFAAYWQVRTPRDKVCWVWGRRLNIQGNTDNLAVGKVPPPPPGAFSIRLLRQDTCFGFRFIVFSVTNRGPKPIESLKVVIKDLDTGYIYEVPPTQRDHIYHCGAYVDPLKPGEEVELWVTLRGANLSGHTIQVSGEACTKDGLSGECVKRTPFNMAVP